MAGFQNEALQQPSLLDPNSKDNLYRPRNPEDSLLFQVIRDHWRTFEEITDQEGSGLPRLAREEFEAFFRCGVLQHGFVRLNIHYHSLFFEGAYLLPESPEERPKFFEINAPNNKEMAALLIWDVRLSGARLHQVYPETECVHTLAPPIFLTQCSIP